jgi:hypothetical protein
VSNKKNTQRLLGERENDREREREREKERERERESILREH